MITTGKIGLMGLAMLAFCACAADRDRSAAAAAAEDTDSIQLDMIGLQGRWRLASYRVDCRSVTFGSDGAADYMLSFNESDNTFGLTTDCNMIGGSFAGANDTIWFGNISATEMACDNMAVEENLLRLMNDRSAYAIRTGDSIFYTAPCIGTATFVKLP